MSSYATKYFAIKTTVGQEKTVANILEARLHGIFLDYMDEPAGMFTITSEKHAAVVFTPPKTTDLIGVEAYIGKKGDPSEPLTACINEYSQETGITETCLGEGRFDPLLLKTEEWIRIKLQNPVKVKRDNTYALVLLKRNAEDGAYEWFYGKESREEFSSMVYENGQWSGMGYSFLFKLLEKTAIASILVIPDLRGYIYVEAAQREEVANIIQNIRHVKARPPMPITFETISSHLVAKPLIEVIEPGQLVEIVSGPLKGIVGKVIRVEKARREITLELREATYQLPISVSIDAVRPVK
jgi:transcriptional antiterminator NusG